MHGLIGTHDSSNRMWWNLGARAMHDKLIEQFTLWAKTCPNKDTADDLWDFIIKAREMKVDFDTHA